MIFCRRASPVGRCSASVWAAWRMLPAVIAAVLWTAACQPPKIVGLSSLMVDKIYRLEDPKNTALVEIIRRHHRPEEILKEIHKNVPVAEDAVVGGSGLNVLRVYRGLVDRDFPEQKAPTVDLVKVLGSVGADSDGDEVRQTIADAHINGESVRRVATEPTGYAMALVESEAVTMVPVHGANAVLPFKTEGELSNALKQFLTPLFSPKEILKELPTAPIIFVDGNVLGAVPAEATTIFSGCEIPNGLVLVDRLANYAAKHQMFFVLSLGAESVVAKHRKFLRTLLLRTSIVFGSKEEFRALIGGREGSPEEVLRNMSGGQQGLTIAVMRTGAKLAKVAYRFCGGTKLVQPRSEEKYDILVDSIGVGDAFVGGFLFGLFKPGRKLRDMKEADAAIQRGLVYGEAAASAIAGTIGFGFDIAKVPKREKTGRRAASKLERNNLKKRIEIRELQTDGRGLKRKCPFWK